MSDPDLRTVLNALAKARIDDRYHRHTAAEILAELFERTREPEIRLRARPPRPTLAPRPRNRRVWPPLNDGLRAP